MTEAEINQQRTLDLKQRLLLLSDEESHSSLQEEIISKQDQQRKDSSQCQYEGLHIATKKAVNMSCVPYKRTDKDCHEAFSYFGMFNVTNSDTHDCVVLPSRPICTFLTESRFGPTERVSVTCWRDVCDKSSPVFLGCADPRFGIVHNENDWRQFHSVGELEQELPEIVSRTSINGFNFCLLKCKERSKSVKQALIFPPILKRGTTKTDHANRKININIVLEDSVSRSHFYRSMPRSVQSLRDIAKDSSFQASVLDFELVQSFASYTLVNTQFLMAGKSLEYKSERTNNINILAEKFKRFGYQILMQEDLCWYDGWGSFLSPSYKKNIEPFTEGFKQVFENYKQETNPYLDNVGLSYLSCEILKDLGVTNPFGRKKGDNTLCWDGRSLSEYLLFYVRRFLSLIDQNPAAAPGLTYTHLNTGHEPSGKRIRNDDRLLSRFLEEMVRSENTLTIILSDHGGKTTDYAIQTLQGSLEVYSPMLFMIIPHKVAQRMGKDRLNALIENQKRLVTVSDLYYTITSVAELTESGAAVSQASGLLRPVSVTRTCADIQGLHSEVMCRCEGWTKFLSTNSVDVLWLAEFAVGHINNLVQKQYLAGKSESKHLSGYGNCARFVGKAIERPRQEIAGKYYITTMILVVEPAYGIKSKERFEVQLRHSSIREHRITFIKYTRLSFYSKYENCADRGVDVKLCACATPRRGSHQLSVKKLIRSRHFVDYGLKSSTRSLDSKCLLVTIRSLKKYVVSKRQTRLMSIEVANVCRDISMKVKLGGIHRKTKFSQTLPLSLVVNPRTIHYVLSVLHEWKYGLFRPAFMHVPINHTAGGDLSRKKRDILEFT